MQVLRLPDGMYFDADECHVVSYLGPRSLLMTKAGDFISREDDQLRRLTPLEACEFLLRAQQPIEEFPSVLLPLRQALMVREPVPPLSPPSQSGIPRANAASESTIWLVTISRWLAAVGWSDEEQSQRLLEIQAMRRMVEAELTAAAP